MNLINNLPYLNKAIRNILALANAGVIANDKFPYIENRCGDAAIHIWNSLRVNNMLDGWKLMLAIDPDRRTIYHAWLENGRTCVDLATYPKPRVVIDTSEGVYHFCKNELHIPLIREVDTQTLYEYIKT